MLKAPKSAIQAMLPPWVQDAGLEDRRRANLLVGTLVLLGCTDLFYTSLSLLVGYTDVALIIGSCAVSMGVLLVLNRLWKIHSLVAHLTLATISLATLGSLLQGIGSPSMTLPWLVILPVLAAILIGRGAAVFWLLVVGAAHLGDVIAIHGLAGTDGPGFAMAALNESSDLGVVVVVTGVVVALENGRSKAWHTQLTLEDQLRQAHASLARAHETARMVLDNVGHAMVLVSAKGNLGNERSAAASTMLGQLRPEQPVWEVFARQNPRFAAWIESAFLSAEGGWVPLDVSFSQVPRRVELDGRILDVELRVIDGADVESPVLLVATDVTEVHRALAAERASREAAGLLAQALHDQPLVLSFVREGSRLVSGVASRAWSSADQRRAVHTLKGSAAVMGLTEFSSWLHELEDRLGGDPPGCSETDAGALSARWKALCDPLLALMQRSGADDVVIRRDDLQSLLDRGRAAGVPTDFLTHLRSLSFEPVAPRLHLLAKSVEHLCLKADMEPVQTRVHCKDLRTPPTAAWSAMWSTLSLLARNAVDHAYESPAQRVALGKPKCGSLNIRAWEQNGDIVIEVADDGRGIAWAEVAERAGQLGLPTDTNAELVAALFAEGLSTSRQVTELSGRGMGLSAVQHAAMRLGGAIDLDSRAGAGLTLRITIPIDQEDSPEGAALGLVVNHGVLAC